MRKSVRTWMVGLSAAAVIAMPFAGAAAMQGGQGPRASDGKSLSDEPQATQAMFIATWADEAASRWVTEHNAELARMAPPAAGPRTDQPGPQTTVPRDPDRPVPGTGTRGPGESGTGPAPGAATETPDTSAVSAPATAVGTATTLPPGSLPGGPPPGMLPPGVTDPAMLPPGMMPPGAPGMLPPGAVPPGAAPAQPAAPAVPAAPTPFPTPFVRGGSR